MQYYSHRFVLRRVFMPYIALAIGVALAGIDQLFKYYQELEDFINTNYEKLWLIE